MAESAEWLERLPNWHCFGCDPSHPKGLRLELSVVAPDRLRCELTVGNEYVGAESIVHGGIIATIFDDLMMWCLLRFRHRFHVTAQMEQKLWRPTFAGVPLVAEAGIEEDLPKGRVRLAARLHTAADPETALAEGSGLFVEAPSSILDLIPEDPRREIEDLLKQFAKADA